MVIENIKYNTINEQIKYDENVCVSVYCSTFNHVKYIKECLDKIIAQKCDFKYHIIIIDDCSNDGTTEIIRKYCKDYPNQICGIIAMENTYNNSRRWDIYKDLVRRFCVGKYIAMCEADDYWCDTNKLFKQVNYMESHPECVMSLHNGLIKNCKTGNESIMNSMSKEYDVPIEDIITQKYGNWPTASMVFQKEMFFLDDSFHQKNVGDWPLRMNAALKGKIHYFPDVMSVYRYMLSGSWTSRMYSGNNVKLFLHRLRMIHFLQEYDKFTSNRYGAAIYTRMHTFFPKLSELETNDLSKFDNMYLSCIRHEHLEEAYNLYKSYMEYYYSELKNMKKVREFVEKFQMVYIYGTGEYACGLSKLLSAHGINIDGYIVSDGQDKSSADKKILYFSEVLGENIGVLVALSPTNMIFIRENLQKLPSNSIYYFYIFVNVIKYLDLENINKFVNVCMENKENIHVNERVLAFCDNKC